MKDEDKIKLGLDSLKDFFDQFGPNDIYKKVFLEVLFEELLSVSLSGETRQEGNQTNINIDNGTNGTSNKNGNNQSTS